MTDLPSQLITVRKLIASGGFVVRIAACSATSLPRLAMGSGGEIFSPAGARAGRAGWRFEGHEAISAVLEGMANRRGTVTPLTTPS